MKQLLVGAPRNDTVTSITVLEHEFIKEVSIFF